MALYKLYFLPSVGKDFRPIPKQDRRKILERIDSLAMNPRPPGVEKLTGQERYRLRQGQYRILYSIQDSNTAVYIVKVGHRRDIYRKK